MQESTSVATASASASEKFLVMLSDDVMVVEDMTLMDKNTSSSLSSMPVEGSAVSDTTVSSSSRSRSSSCSSTDSSVDALNDDYGAHVLSSSEEENDDKQRAERQDVENETTRHFLVKPMPSRLQVCPVDDLAIEDEKRRRRSRRHCKNKGNGKNKTPSGISRDTESLPSMPSPIRVRTHRSGSSPDLLNCISSVTRDLSARDSHTSKVIVGQTPLPPAVPLLRKDSAAIRRQYWSQLGFSLSRSDLEKSTGRKKERREGLKVRLNDAASKHEQSSKGFFQFIASWYMPMTVVSGEDETLRKDKGWSKTSGKQLRSFLSQSSMSNMIDDSTAVPLKKRVHFNEEAELFYIPLHRDYSKRQRDCMWPTRAEFIAMVERNLDAVYDEMEREYEAQVENEYLENEGMAREEARQRTMETQQQIATESRGESRRSLSPPLSRSSSTMSSSVPMLTLSQKQVLVSPRARSSHDLRFKYLKHLGIDS